MTLIVEDGSLMAGANAYADLNYIKIYALDRGVTLGSDEQIETWNANAMDYMEGKRAEYEGTKVAAFQSLQFPRIGIVVDGFEIPSTVVPKEAKNASCQLIIEQSLGVNLMPTMEGAAVKSETVGPIKTDYAVTAGNHPMPMMPYVDALLKPLLKRGAGASPVFRRV